MGESSYRSISLMETIKNTSTASLKLTGVVPAVCDAEAGQQHSSKSELVQALGALQATLQRESPKK